MLPAGKYVVEVVVPPGYELVKEEDKNILIGDNYIAPVTQQFAGLGNIFILPDQADDRRQLQRQQPAEPDHRLWAGPRLPSHEGDTGSVETFWPCVGAARIVPDFISLFPQSQEVAPFAGATRNLCDRKEVTLDDQMRRWRSSTSSPRRTPPRTSPASSPTTSPRNSIRSRRSSARSSAPPEPAGLHQGLDRKRRSRASTPTSGDAYNGLTYSTWEVNPPNPTGYAPTMMVTCMNDPGPIRTGEPSRSRSVQPGLQPVLLRDPVHAGQTAVHGYAGGADVGLRGGLQQS